MEKQENGKYIYEPHGHGKRYSKIERLWNEIPLGCSITQTRIERFDHVASLLYSPVEYLAEDISENLPTTLPPEDWLAESLTGFVLGEFSSENIRIRPSTFDPIEKISDASEDQINKYLENCESELVYGGILKGLNPREFRSIEEAIYLVLTSPILGNPINRRYLDSSAFASLIAPSVHEKKRLQFILPSFPFKDQNVFRTEAPPDHVDFGEIALMIRLHTLALAFFQIHPYGADWIILSDGASYANALGIDPNMAESYKENLRDIRNRLNLQGTVTILDLNKLAIFSDGEKSKGRFEFIQNGISDILGRMIYSREDVKNSFDVLTRGIIWNLSTREYLRDYSPEEIWNAVTCFSSQSPTTKNNKLCEIIYERGRKAAIYYAAYNLALRWLSIPNCIFPESIRATVHPKKNQVAVPSLGPVYPWNGIPIVHNMTYRANDVSTTTWCEIRKNGRELLGHSERPNSPPLFYTIHD